MQKDEENIMKLKKIFVAIITIMALTCMAACGSSKKTTDNGAKIDSQSAEIKGNVIKIDENIKDVMAKIGETKDYEQSKSCMYNGYDKAFKYSDCTIRTYPNGDDDYVNSIEIYSSDINIEKNVHVGDSKDTVINEYGNNPKFETDTYITYEKDNSGITFYYTDNKISEIEVYKIEK